MSLLIALIVGGIIGWVAARIGGRDEGIVASIAIGIVGSIIGGLLSTALSGGDQAYLTFSWSGFIWSLIGALILVFLLNAVQHRPHHPNV